MPQARRAEQMHQQRLRARRTPTGRPGIDSSPGAPPVPSAAFRPADAKANTLHLSCVTVPPARITEAVALLWWVFHEGLSR